MENYTNPAILRSIHHRQDPLASTRIKVMCNFLALEPFSEQGTTKSHSERGLESAVAG
jgi:hypothetical protein